MYTKKINIQYSSSINYISLKLDSNTFKDIKIESIYYYDNDAIKNNIIEKPIVLKENKAYVYFQNQAVSYVIISSNSPEVENINISYGFIEYPKFGFFETKTTKFKDIKRIFPIIEIENYQNYYFSIELNILYSKYKDNLSFSERIPIAYNTEYMYLLDYKTNDKLFYEPYNNLEQINGVHRYIPKFYKEGSEYVLDHMKITPFYNIYFNSNVDCNVNYSIKYFNYTEKNTTFKIKKLGIYANYK